MKPELANLFTINATGKHSDFVLSFFYEWQKSEDGKTTDLKKQEVASVVLNIGDFMEFTDTVAKIRAKFDELVVQAESEEAK